ncbi:DNA polymerase III subunit delta' [Paenibacillus turpanensis]|uniref:DNA polymerase III subunit delta' n=1 Tax=Paenibacillus turpanensis TaxID=2689078 RepID=UPI001409AAA5|nr:DNA polymerase III subunit delta' [Paenibacillus turpanensis]
MAYALADIIGQERAKQMLQSGLRRGRTSHAYIFSGPPGTQRKEAALAFAAALLCEAHGEDACGSCLSCRKVASGNHEGIVMVEPEGSSIKIEQIRELQKQFAYRSQAKRSVYILGAADRMTVQAANSLLKFLEEPSQAVTAILITDNGHALLPTIKSRAQWIPFTPLPASTMAELLRQEGRPDPLVRAAVRISSGIEQARDFIQLNWFAEMRNLVLQLAKESLSGSGSALVTANALLSKPDLQEGLETCFDLFLLLFKDMISIQSGVKQSIVYIDQTDWLSKQAFAKSAAEWVRMMEHAMEGKKRLRFHANPQLVLEQFVISLQGGSYANV